jgi:hypothetical protein
MRLLRVPHAGLQGAVSRRLSNALRIEAYFYHLLSENQGDEVFRQWSASRRLLTRSLLDYSSILDGRRPRTRPGDTR